MTDKILVGVDFSPESDAAVRHALAVARHRGAELVLAHAGTLLEKPTFSGDTPAGVLEYYAQVEADVAANRNRLAELRERIGGQGVNVSHVLLDGFPDTALVACGREIGASMLVVGSHGRTGVKWLLLGSVAQRVVRLAERDVLVARGDAPAGGYRKIMVATDFSPSADRALASALTMAARDAVVEVAHFWVLPVPVGINGPMAMPPIDDLRAAVDAQLQARGQSLLASLARRDVDLRFHSIMAPVLPGAVDRLASEGHDLAVVGSHGRRGLRRFVLGSVAEGVVQKAPCAVLVVHGVPV
jgi:nucleotide-binding universal stress UspA family protein